MGSNQGPSFCKATVQPGHPWTTFLQDELEKPSLSALFVHQVSVFSNGRESESSACSD